MKKVLVPILEIFEMVAIVFVSIYIIYGFVAQPFLVQGASMEPSFRSGDYLLVDEVTYRLREPERGEVIVFRNPTNESEFFIKRIIGLPGEQVIINGGRVLIDGEVLSEEYLPYGVEVRGEHVFTLDENEYFVMGDNRPASYDSRRWGPLTRDRIVGVVRLRFWPPSTFGTLSYE